MASESPNSFRDPYWSGLASKAEEKYGLTPGLLVSVLTNGERSNKNQVSEAGASTVFQIIPKTREQILKRDGIDAYLNDQNAADAAALVLKDGVNWARGKAKTPTEADALAAGYYHAGGDTANWGPKTQAYMNRVGVGIQNKKVDTLSSGFAEFMKANPAVAPVPQPAAPASAKDELSADFGKWMEAQQNPGQIPGPNGETVVPPPQQPEPSLGDKIVGAGEAGLAMATGAIGGTLGMVRGTAGGMAQAIRDGSFGTPEAMRMVEQSAMEQAANLTYAPRTATGQEYAQAAGGAMAQALPIAGLSGEMAMLGNAGRAARPSNTSIPSAARSAAAPVMEAVQGAMAPVAEAVAPAMQRARQAVGAVPGQVSQAMGRSPTKAPTPGTMGSVGAAGVDMSTVRRMQADELPVPIKLTEGQATRDFAQQQFERETAKNPELGAPLRAAYEEQNQNILRNFDAWVDQTGAEAPSLRAAGATVDKVLVAKAKRDKTEINVKYAAARRSPEARATVDQNTAVTIGEGDQAMTSTPLQFINEQPTGLPSTAVADAARQYAVRLGVASLDDGQLVANPRATIANMESWRSAINEATGYEKTDIRQATVLKKLIDAQTEPVAGPLYRMARRARENYANQYENRGVIARLLETKRGSNDRQVAFEDIFDHSILRGSLDDVRTVRKVLQTEGAEGKQAWKELQGQTVGYIRDQAAKNITTDSRGNRVISPAGLDKAIKELDKDGKLDFVFGRKGAEQMRAINDLAKHVYTAPPGSVNTSNTASILLAALDMGVSSSAGLPLPIASGLKLVIKNVKDKKIRNRVSAALRQPGTP